MFQVSSNPGNFANVLLTIGGDNKPVETVEVHEIGANITYTVWGKPQLVMYVNSSTIPNFTVQNGNYIAELNTSGYYKVVFTGPITSIVYTNIADADFIYLTSSRLSDINHLFENFSGEFYWTTTDSDIANIENVNGLFKNATLTEYEAPARLKPVTAVSMFEGASITTNPTTIHFDGSRLTDVSSAFKNSDIPVELDWTNTTNTLDATSMFEGASGRVIMFSGDPQWDCTDMFKNSTMECLTQISTINATSTNDMFSGAALLQPDATAQSSLIQGAQWTNQYTCPQALPPQPFDYFFLDEVKPNGISFAFDLNRGLPAAQVDLLDENDVVLVTDITSPYDYQVLGAQGLKLKATNASGTVETDVKYGYGLDPAFEMEATTTQFSMNFTFTGGDVTAVRQSDSLTEVFSDGVSKTIPTGSWDFTGLNISEFISTTDRSTSNHQTVETVHITKHETLTRLDDAFRDSGITSFIMDTDYFPRNVYMGSTFRGSDLQTFQMDTSAVLTLSSTFRSCSSLTSFPLIDLSSMLYLWYSWRDCPALTSFPLLDTSTVINLLGTWRDCTSLTSFPLLDTSAVINMKEAWARCTSLTSFPLLDTSEVTDFTDTWWLCESLNSFPAIDTSSGIKFDYTWYDCYYLTCLSTVNTINATSTENMLGSIANLIAPTPAEVTLIENGYNYVNAGSCPIPLVPPGPFTSFSASTNLQEEIQIDFVLSDYGYEPATIDLLDSSDNILATDITTGFLYSYVGTISLKVKATNTAGSSVSALDTGTGTTPPPPDPITDFSIVNRRQQRPIISFTETAGETYELLLGGVSQYSVQSGDAKKVLNGTLSIRSTNAHGTSTSNSISYTSVDYGDDYVTYWDIQDGTLRFPTESQSYYEYNCTVDWGDGTPLETMTSYNDSKWTHTYATNGFKKIVISGQFMGQDISDFTVTRTKLIEVLNLGRCDWGDRTNSPNVRFQNSFTNASNLTFLDFGSTDLFENANNYWYPFSGCGSLIEAHGAIDTSLATSNTGFFRTCRDLICIDSFKTGAVAKDLFDYTDDLVQPDAAAQALINAGNYTWTNPGTCF